MNISAASTLQILWTFSIYLEAVAILPQLVLLQRTQNVDNITANYVFLLGSYRALYLLNWVYRFFTESRYRQWIGETVSQSAAALAATAPAPSGSTLAAQLAAALSLSASPPAVPLHMPARTAFCIPPRRGAACGAFAVAS